MVNLEFKENYKNISLSIQNYVEDQNFHRERGSILVSALLKASGYTK